MAIINPEEATIAIFVSEDYIRKKIKVKSIREKESHYILLKSMIYWGCLMF